MEFFAAVSYFPERREGVLPWFVASDSNDREQEPLVKDVLAEVVHDLLEPRTICGPGRSGSGSLFVEPSKRLPALCEAWEWLDSLVRVPLDESSECARQPHESTSSCSKSVVTVSVEPEQTSLAATAEVGE